MQNFLAQQSKGEILYLCSKCGKDVPKEASICNHCGAKLGKIRCPFCNFVGEIEDFKYDTCPKCGRKQDKGKNNIKPSNKKTYHISLKLFWVLLSVLIGILMLLFIIFLYNFEFI